MLRMLRSNNPVQKKIRKRLKSIRPHIVDYTANFEERLKIAEEAYVMQTMLILSKAKELDMLGSVGMYLSDVLRLWKKYNKKLSKEYIKIIKELPQIEDYKRTVYYHGYLDDIF